MIFSGYIRCTQTILEQFFDAKQLTTLHGDDIRYAVYLRTVEVQFAVGPHTVGIQSLTNMLVTTAKGSLVVQQEVVVHQFFVYFHSFAFGSCCNQCIYEVLLQGACHDVRQGTAFRSGKDVAMQAIHQLYHRESLFAVHRFVLQHTHQAVVAQQIPKDIGLGILQHLCRCILHYAQRSVAQQVGVLSHFRVEQPFGIGQHFVQQELQGCLLLFFFYEGIGFLSVAHNGVFYIDTTDVCQYMIEVIVPLVDNRIV